MADIFISYARADCEVAQRLADALEQVGWSVWWDPQIPVGRHFEEVIEEQLAMAGCVVVLWSQHSVRSHWVRSEAADGRERDILAPVRLDDAEIPLSFRGIQTADLRGWDGESNHAGLSGLARDISARLRPSGRGGFDAPCRAATQQDKPVIKNTAQFQQSYGSRLVKRSPSGPAAFLASVLGVAIGSAVGFQYAYPTVSLDAGLVLLFTLTGFVVTFLMRLIWRIVRATGKS